MRIRKNELTEAYLRYISAGDYERAYQCLENLYGKEVQNFARIPDDIRALELDLRRRLKRMIELGSESAKHYELLHRTYVLSGKESFDDFMIAVEWYRPMEKRYWLPRRAKLLPIAEALEDMECGGLNELFLSMPPRCGKSTLILFFLIWVMCRDSERTNIYSSYTADVVAVLYNGALEILTDADTYAIQEVFPGVQLGNTNAAIGFLNVGRRKRYPSLMCRAINAALNGLGDASGYIVIDDIHSGIDEARNPEILKKTWSTVSNNLLARRKSRTRFLWIGTRWSLYDCISRRIEIVERGGAYRNWKWKVVNIPAMNENDESNFDYPFGLGFSTEDYKRTREMFEESDDIASWLAQYMGTPIERDGAVFEPTSLKYYNGELPKEDPDRIFMAVDPAWGGGDYVSAPIVFQYEDDLVIHDVIYDNGDKHVTRPLLVEAISRYGVQAVYVEGTRTTAAYAEELDKALKERGIRVNLQRTTKHWASGGGKSQRIFDKAPEIRTRMIFRDEKVRSKAYQKFMNNLYAFTVEGKQKHDDAPDSLAMVLVHSQIFGNKMRVRSRDILDAF